MYDNLTHDFFSYFVNRIDWMKKTHTKQFVVCAIHRILITVNPFACECVNVNSLVNLRWMNSVWFDKFTDFAAYDEIRKIMKILCTNNALNHAHITFVYFSIFRWFFVAVYVSHKNMFIRVQFISSVCWCNNCRCI